MVSKQIKPVAKKDVKKSPSAAVVVVNAPATPKERPAALLSPLAAMKKELDEAAKEKTKLLGMITVLENDKTQLNSQINACKSAIEKFQNDKVQLLRQIDDFKKSSAPAIKVDDLTTTFKETLKSMQRETGKAEKPGETGYIIDKFEVEMKAGLDLRDGGIKLVQPAAAELKPESLSTVRVSFKAKPKIKIAEE